jgi:flavin-binding protein dodecin
MAPKVIDEVGTSKESLLRQRKNAVADAAEPFGPEKGVSSGIRDGT